MVALRLPMPDFPLPQSTMHSSQISVPVSQFLFGKECIFCSAISSWIKRLRFPRWIVPMLSYPPHTGCQAFRAQDESRTLVNFCKLYDITRNTSMKPLININCNKRKLPGKILANITPPPTIQQQQKNDCSHFPLSSIRILDSDHEITTRNLAYEKYLFCTQTKHCFWEQPVHLKKLVFKFRTNWWFRLKIQLRQSAHPCLHIPTHVQNQMSPKWPQNVKCHKKLMFFSCLRISVGLTSINFS